MENLQCHKNKSNLSGVKLFSMTRYNERLKTTDTAKNKQRLLALEKEVTYLPLHTGGSAGFHVSLLQKSVLGPWSLYPTLHANVNCEPFTFTLLVTRPFKIVSIFLHGAAERKYCILSVMVKEF